MIAAPAALRLKQTSPNVARPYVAPRRRPAAGPQTRRQTASRQIAVAYSWIEQPDPRPASDPCATAGAAAAVAALAMALAGEQVAERTLPASPPARFRDIEVRPVQAWGTSNVDLEALFDDPATGGFSTALLGADPAMGLPSRDAEAGSTATGALFVELDAPLARVAEFLWLGDDGARDLYPVLDHV